MITIKTTGDWRKTEQFFAKASKNNVLRILEKYGRKGVQALAANTPRETGLTANSWDFNVIQDGTQSRIEFFNTNNQNGSNIAILLQYGHGTGTGGYVQGRDYINPAIQPVFDEMVEEMWKEVTNA